MFIETGSYLEKSSLKMNLDLDLLGAAWLPKQEAQELLCSSPEVPPAVRFHTFLWGSERPSKLLQAPPGVREDLISPHPQHHRKEQKDPLTEKTNRNTAVWIWLSEVSNTGGFRSLQTKDLIIRRVCFIGQCFSMEIIKLYKHPYQYWGPYWAVWILLAVLQHLLSKHAYFAISSYLKKEVHWVFYIPG